MIAWLKPEVIVAAFFGFIGVAGTLTLNWSNANTHSALNDHDMQILQSDVKAIRDSVVPLPLYAQRISQLERDRDSQIGYNGSVDGRMNALERAKDVMTSQLENIRAASGLTADGRKMR